MYPSVGNDTIDNYWDEDEWSRRLAQSIFLFSLSTHFWGPKTGHFWAGRHCPVFARKFGFLESRNVPKCVWEQGEPWASGFLATLLGPQIWDLAGEICGKRVQGKLHYEISCDSVMAGQPDLGHLRIRCESVRKGPLFVTIGADRRGRWSWPGPDPGHSRNPET